MVEEGRAGTLDVLEARRVAIEAEYLECMHGLQVRADELRDVLDGLALASAEDAGHSPSLETGGAVVPEAPLIGAIGEPAGRFEPAGRLEPAQWSPQVAGLPGRLAAWLLGDILPMLEQRQAAIEGGLVALQGELVVLRSDVSGALEHVREQTARLEVAVTALRATQDQQRAAAAEERTADLLRWRGVGEALDQAVGVLAEVTRLSERLRAVVDAKGAEGLQRAVDGPSLQVEVIVDELARRQEALLAELVGRRQELDALIESVSRGD